jgi:AcrR family transcriptional regulator
MEPEERHRESRAPSAQSRKWAGSKPFEDPTPNLSPTAERLLEAARVVLRRDGLDHLTFEAIAAESGETQSLIRYHFGDKAGLIRTLVESELFIESSAVMSAVCEAPPGEERRLALLRKCRDIATAKEEMRSYLELLPRIARDESLRPLLKTLVDWYVRLNAWALSPDPEHDRLQDLEPLATLVYAVADGMALRSQADPAADINPPFDLLESMVEQYLRSRRQTPGESEAP